MADQAGGEKRPGEGVQGAGSGDWMGDLAKRSSGVPPAGGHDEAPREELRKEGSSAWRFAGLGFEFAGTVGLFAYFGFWLDRHFGWAPWGTVTLVLIAVIGNMYLLIKEAMRQGK